MSPIPDRTPRRAEPTQADTDAALAALQEFHERGGDWPLPDVLAWYIAGARSQPASSPSLNDPIPGRERKSRDLLLEACRQILGELPRDDARHPWLRLQIEKALVICPETESER